MYNIGLVSNDPEITAMLTEEIRQIKYWQNETSSQGDDEEEDEDVTEDYHKFEIVNGDGWASLPEYKSDEVGNLVIREQVTPEMAGWFRARNWKLVGTWDIVSLKGGWIDGEEYGNVIADYSDTKYEYRNLNSFLRINYGKGGCTAHKYYWCLPVTVEEEEEEEEEEDERENMNYTLKHFESKQSMEDYIGSKDYHTNNDTIGICFGIIIDAMDGGDKGYNIEFMFND